MIQINPFIGPAVLSSDCGLGNVRLQPDRHGRGWIAFSSNRNFLKHIMSKIDIMCFFYYYKLLIPEKLK